MERKKKRMLAFAACILFLAGFPVSALADSVNAKKVLNQYQFDSHSAGGDIGRKMGWGFIIGLHWLVGGIESVVYKINSTLGGFFTSSGVQYLQQNKILPLTVALLVLVILVIGILFIIKPRDFTTIAGNLVIGIVIALGLPAFLSGAYGLTTQAIQFLDTGSSGKPAENVSAVLSDRILVDNITDNTMYDASNFKKPEYKNRYAVHGADVSAITKIDPTEVVDPGKTKHPDVWKNRLVTGQDGHQSLSALWDGKVGFVSIPDMAQYYYRWNIDWFTIISTLIITGFSLILSGIKIARLLYELAINQTLTQIVALLDIATAQRVRRCLRMLISTFFTLFAVFFTLQIYIIGNACIAKAGNPFLRLILMLALAWSVIDGPDLFEQIFGIDAGVHNAVRTMYGIKAAGSILAGGAAFIGGRSAMESIRSKGIAGMAKGAVGKAGSAAGGLGGMAAGTIAGAADNRRRYAAARNGQGGPGGGRGPSAAQTPRQPGPTESRPYGSPQQGGPSGSASPEKAQPNGSAGAGPFPAASAGSPVPEPGRPASSVRRQGGPYGSAKMPGRGGNAPRGPESRPDFKGSQTPGPGRGQTAAPGQQPGAWENGAPEKPRAGTVGGYAGGKIRDRVEKAGAVRSARHLYSLAYGSRMAHGDKKVRQESLAYRKMQENPSLNHSQAVWEAKREIRESARRNKKQSGDERK